MNSGESGAALGGQPARGPCARTTIPGPCRRNAYSPYAVAMRSSRTVFMAIADTFRPPTASQEKSQRCTSARRDSVAGWRGRARGAHLTVGARRFRGTAEWARRMWGGACGGRTGQELGAREAEAAVHEQLVVELVLKHRALHHAVDVWGESTVDSSQRGGSHFQPKFGAFGGAAGRQPPGHPRAEGSRMKRVPRGERPLCSLWSVTAAGTRLRACCMFLNCDRGTCTSSIAPALAIASAPPASIRICPEASISPKSASLADPWLNMLARAGASLARGSPATDMEVEIRLSLGPAGAAATAMRTGLVPTVTEEARASAETSLPPPDAPGAAPAFSPESLPLGRTHAEREEKACAHRRVGSRAASLSAVFCGRRAGGRRRSPARAL